VTTVTATIQLKEHEGDGDTAEVKVTGEVLGPDDVLQVATEAAERAIAVGDEAKRQKDERA
jgi:hypothetical protein